MNCKSTDFNNLKLFNFSKYYFLLFFNLYFLDNHGKIILIHQIVL